MIHLQDKLDFLLHKYAVLNTATFINPSTVAIDEREIPLLPWRSERRFIELKGLVLDGTVTGISALRICRIEPKGANLQDMLFRELDLCEWLLDSEVAELFTIANQAAASNSIVKLRSGVICTIEVAATLSPDMESIDKHEIIAERGVASDRVVDTQVPQQSIYVFANNRSPSTYTDVDFELFGATAAEAAIIRQAFAASTNASLRDELTASASHVRKLVDASEQSATRRCNMIL